MKLLEIYRFLDEAEFPWHKFDEPKMKPGDYERGSSEFGDPKKARHLPKRQSQKELKNSSFKDLEAFDKKAAKKLVEMFEELLDSSGFMDSDVIHADPTSVDLDNWEFTTNADGTITAQNDHVDHDLEYMPSSVDGRKRWGWK